jgi:hypothetical protein
MKNETQDAELLEKLILDKTEKNTGIKLKSNYWMVMELEKLLNCYPELRKFNYKKMSLEEIKALIQILSGYLEIQYSEDNDLILVDLTEKKKLFTLRELIMWLIIASLTDKSHVHFKYSEKFLNERKVSEASAIDFLCDNSYFIKNRAKGECHFILSVAAMLSFDYSKQDKIINSLISIQKYRKKNLSLSAYIKYRNYGQNIDEKPKLQIQSKRIKIKF